MTDLKCLYVLNPAWLLPFIFPFLLYLAAVTYCDFWVIPCWIYPSKSSPARSVFCSHSNSLSLAPALPPTSVACKNLNSGATAFLFASKPASHLLSAWACHKTPSFLVPWLVFFVLSSISGIWCINAQPIGPFPCTTSTLVNPWVGEVWIETLPPRKYFFSV